jgi:ABC-type transport system substrate-binding protein
MFLPDSPYYDVTGYPARDPAGAAALIRQYTAQHGPPVTQLSTTPDPRITQLVQVVQEMWTRVGVQSSITIVQQAGAIVDLLEGNFQAVPSAQFGAVDPGLNYPWLSTTTVEPIGAIRLNFSRNSDPAIESALLSGRSTLDHATRVAAYRT